MPQRNLAKKTAKKRCRNTKKIMISKRKILIDAPILNELVFDYIFTLTKEQKSKFSPKELRAVKTAKKARHFAETSTIDEKLLLLAKMGVEYSFVLHKREHPIDNVADIKARYDKYKKMSKEDVLKDMACEKFVVITDRQISNFMSIMGNNSNSPIFMLNMDYHRTGRFLNNWKKYSVGENLDGKQESLEFARVINKYTLLVSMALKNIQGYFMMSDIDINLLMFFYDRQGKYTPREIVENAFLGQYKITILTAAIKRLIEKVLIEKNPVKKLMKPEYQITGLGIQVVMDFHTKNMEGIK